MKTHVEPRVIVEDTHRIPLRRLYLQGHLRPAELTMGTLPGCGLHFRGWLTEGGTGGWIEIAGHRWEIRSQPIVLQNRWWQDEHLFVQGRDGKLAKELLVTRDLAKVGTRGELGAHYRGQHVNTRTRTLKQRQRIFAQLLILDDPANMTRCYVPEDGAGGDHGLVMEGKPKGMWWQTWWRRFRHSQPDVVIVPVRRPCGINTSRFRRYLDQINAHHTRTGKIRRLSPPASSRRSPAPPRSRRQAGAGDVDGSGVIGWMESVFKRS